MTQFERENPGVDVIPPEGKEAAPEFPLKKIVIMGLIMLLYTGSPIDLIPDFIPLFGQLDDLLVNAGMLGMVARSVLKYYSLKRSFRQTGFMRHVMDREVYKRAVPVDGRKA